MAKLSIGKVRPTPRGEYDPLVAYEPLDIVSFNGSSYMASYTPPVGVDPTNGAYWQLSSSKGADGARGPQGVTGDQGIQGIQGIQGEIGPSGPIGPAGPQGLEGPQGPEGPQGIQGIQGVQGDEGPMGPAGPAGAKGDTGAQGLSGPQGPSGDAPSHQWSGTSLRFTNPDGSNGSYVDLKGAKGDTGPQGAQGPTGPQGDQGPVGPNLGIWKLGFNNSDDGYLSADGEVGFHHTDGLAVYRTYGKSDSYTGQDEYLLLDASNVQAGKGISITGGKGVDSGPVEFSVTAGGWENYDGSEFAYPVFDLTSSVSTLLFPMFEAGYDYLVTGNMIIRDGNCEVWFDMNVGGTWRTGMQLDTVTQNSVSPVSVDVTSPAGVTFPPYTINRKAGGLFYYGDGAVGSQCRIRFVATWKSGRAGSGTKLYLLRRKSVFQ